MSVVTFATGWFSIASLEQCFVCIGVKLDNRDKRRLLASRRKCITQWTDTAGFLPRNLSTKTMKFNSLMIFTLLSPLVSVDVQNVGKSRDEKREFVRHHAFFCRWSRPDAVGLFAFYSLLRGDILKQIYYYTKLTMYQSWFSWQRKQKQKCLSAHLHCSLFMVWTLVQPCY